MFFQHNLYIAATSGPIYPYELFPSRLPGSRTEAVPQLGVARAELKMLLVFTFFLLLAVLVLVFLLLAWLELGPKGPAPPVTAILSWPCEKN